jgi:hypothetical protein
MKTRKLKYKPLISSCLFVPLIILIGCVCSCKKFVQVPPPNSQLVTASVFNNDGAATSAITNIYTQMFNNSESFFIARSNGLLADELQYNGTSITFLEPYHNAMTALNAIGSGYTEWPKAYSYIFQANAAIAALHQYSGTTPAIKQQLLGEAYFIRAFWHLYLTNCHGAVPLVLTTDYTVVDQLARTPRVQVLQQVISDLQLAKTMLSTNYVDGTDTVTTVDRVRPTKAVATALLARAYLYLGDYDSQNATYYVKADSAANAVINNSEYSLCPNLSGPTNSVFLKNSSEAIWQIYTPLPSTINTKDGNNFILLAAPNSSQFTVSPQLLGAFESGDQRQANWIGSITKNGQTYYFPYKYKVQNGGTPISEYTMVLRLAEQYLIRAEAKAEEGDPAGAVSDLNVIRNRAGLPNYSGPTDQASLLAAILHERQVELFTEWGHRWYDLERAAANPKATVNINAVMSVVTPLKSGTWSSYKALYPIPLQEIQKDVNLTQNTGY